MLLPSYVNIVANILFTYIYHTSVQTCRYKHIPAYLCTYICMSAWVLLVIVLLMLLGVTTSRLLTNYLIVSLSSLNCHYNVNAFGSCSADTDIAFIVFKRLKFIHKKKNTEFRVETLWIFKKVSNVFLSKLTITIFGYIHSVRGIKKIINFLINKCKLFLFCDIFELYLKYWYLVLCIISLNCLY